MSANRPNILVAISDDQAWPHTSAYGCTFVNTPAFDRVAHEGVLFDNAFCPAPQCSPSRAGLLTGLNMWQLEEAALLWGLLPAKYDVYPDILECAGYKIGLTHKGWGPGSVEASGRTRNPAGPQYNRHSCDPPTRTMSRNDYAANFREFLEERENSQPFCFWYGAKEPHRQYEKGSGLRAGKRLEDVQVPSYLPDCDEVRSDLLDYALEIERFDEHLGRMMDLLEERGELDNTIIVVTGDNGLPFPRAKSNLYEHGMHVPLAIRWGDRVPRQRRLTDLVSFIDLAPTFIEAAGLPVPPHMSGRSLVDVLCSEADGRVDPTRDRLLMGKERHAYCRPHNQGYPSRCLRTDEFIYVRNYKPERWPAGNPDAYGDVDHSPTKEYILAHRDEEGTAESFDLAFGKRPEEELYRLADGSGCMTNIADQPDSAETKEKLRAEMEMRLTEQGDPRMKGLGALFDSYPYYGNIGSATRGVEFEGFKERGTYNPDALKQD